MGPLSHSSFNLPPTCPKPFIHIFFLFNLFGNLPFANPSNSTQRNPSCQITITILDSYSSSDFFHTLSSSHKDIIHNNNLWIDTYVTDFCVCLMVPCTNNLPKLHCGAKSLILLHRTQKVVQQNILWSQCSFTIHVS